MAAAGEVVTTPRDVECFDLACRSVLNKCSSDRMPFDFTINPYRGCELSCAYCYARYTHEFLDLSPGKDFERRIYAKRGAARVLAKELLSHDRARSIAIGTATDPYQPLERKLGLTRSILSVFAEASGLRLHVTTKSDLILRDLDVLERVARRNALDVSLTVTTLDSALARTLEPRAPTPEKRLGAVRALAEAGILVRVLVAPILPWITDARASLLAVLGAARMAGARGAYGQVLFLPDATRPSFFQWLGTAHPELVPRYRRILGRSNYVAPGVSRPIMDRFHALRRECWPDKAWEEEPAPPAATAGQLGLFGGLDPC